MRCEWKSRSNACCWLSVVLRYCNHRSMSQLGCRHLSPATPPASTSSETSSTSQVFLKGPVVRVLLVRC
jgi:hypothetical protein